MYGWESWTIKKVEHQGIDAFELWCWGRLLRVPWTARRSNQSILKKSVLNIHWRTDTEAETPTLWPPDANNWLIGRDPDSGKDWRQVEKGMTQDELVGCYHWLNGHMFEQDPGDGMDRETWYAAVHGITKNETWLINWITTTARGFGTHGYPYLLRASLFLSVILNE